MDGQKIANRGVNLKQIYKSFEIEITCKEANGDWQADVRIKPNARGIHTIMPLFGYSSERKCRPGAFKKYGMEVRYVVTGARTIQALVGGSVQFAQGVSSRTVPAAVLAGADAVLIANFSDKLLFTMHSAPEQWKLIEPLRKYVLSTTAMRTPLESGLGGALD